MLIKRTLVISSLLLLSLAVAACRNGPVDPTPNPPPSTGTDGTFTVTIDLSSLYGAGVAVSRVEATIDDGAGTTSTSDLDLDRAAEEASGDFPEVRRFWMVRQRPVYAGEGLAVRVQVRHMFMSDGWNRGVIHYTNIT